MQMNRLKTRVPRSGAFALVAAATFFLVLATGGQGRVFAVDAPRAIEPPAMSEVIADGAGAAFQLAELRGTPILVNFWATWCAPCVAELPALSRAAARLRGKVKVVLVSVDRGGRVRAEPFLEKHGVVGVLSAYDPKSKLSRQMGVGGLPTTFLLNAEQDTAWSFVGPHEWDAQDMIGLIQGLLE